MRIVIGARGLAAPGGTETYALTVARGLERLGHEAILFTDEFGPLADLVAESGFDVVGNLAELPRECDALLANDAVTAGLLAERYPKVLLAYCVHSTIFDVQLPPLEPGVVDVLVAPSERFAAHARAIALDVPVVRLRQPIDTARFAPTEVPRTPPRRALLLSNYISGRRREALVEVWGEAGIECVHVGATERFSFDPRPAIAAADIVVAKGRAALEGMACGKAVYVFDAYGGDGWVGADTYEAMEADNFAGQTRGMPIDRRGLAEDLERYDADMGWINRELVATHHDARTHVLALLEVLAGPGPRRDADAAAARQGAGASARVVRMAWRMQGLAARYAGEAASERARTERLTAELDAIRAELAELSANLSAQLVESQLETEVVSRDRDAWRRRAARVEEVQADHDACLARTTEAEEGLRRADAVLSSRRVRAALAIGRILDRARGRR